MNKIKSSRSLIIIKISNLWFRAC